MWNKNEQSMFQEERDKKGEITFYTRLLMWNQVNSGNNRFSYMGLALNGLLTDLFQLMLITLKQVPLPFQSNSLFKFFYGCILLRIDFRLTLKLL